MSNDKRLTIVRHISELRRRLIPKASRTPLKDIVSAARAFYRSRNREITLEYVLLAGINDTPQCAEALGGMARSLRCNVNLIRCNPGAPLPGLQRKGTDVADFAAWLRRFDVNANIRRSRGLDAEAACGQLRKRSS